MNTSFQSPGGEHHTSQENNINASGHSNVSVKQQVTIGYTFEQHTQALKDRETQIRSDLERAHAAECGLLETKLRIIEGELNDIRESYERKIAELEKQIKNLEKYQSSVNAEDYEQAKMALFRGNLSLAEKLYKSIEEKSLDLATDALLQRGLIADQELRWTDALLHFRKALLLTPNNEDCAYKFAEMCTKTGLYEEAAATYSRLINRVEGSANPEEILKYAFYSESLGLAYRLMGNYDKALALYERCLEIYKKHLGENHNTLAKTYSDYGGLLEDLWHFEQAEELYKKSLSVYALNGQTDISQLAIVNANLANLFQKMNRFKEAESIFNETIPILRHHFGDNHPIIATFHNNLGELYFNQNRFEDAEKNYYEALLILDKVVGPEHPNLMMTNLNLAGALREQGKFEEAKTLYEKVISYLKSRFGELHPILAAAYKNYSMLFSKQGRYDEAEALVKKAIHIGLKSKKINYLEIIDRYESLALIYHLQDRFLERDEYSRLAQEILKTLKN